MKLKLSYLLETTPRKSKSFLEGSMEGWFSQSKDGQYTHLAREKGW